VFRGPGLRSANPVPGQAWIMVRAPELTAEAIVAALERGDFYASTGVELEDYQATPASITVTVKARPQSVYDVHFIGSGGRILKTSPVDPGPRSSGGDRQQAAAPAVYAIRGHGGYVRARIVESNGNVAWTQPVMVSGRDGP
jgi:hypothetical protein